MAKAKPATKKPAAEKPAAKKPAAKKPPTKTKPPVDAEAERQQQLEATSKARDDVWSAWGALEPDVISHLINPSFMGGPRWPAMRQAYRVARRGPDVLIASDGLADPYDAEHGPQDENGLGLELFAITDDSIARAAEGVAQYGATWLHDLVFHCAQLAANHGGVGSLLDELGAISTELNDVKIPEAHRARYVNEHGRFGILLSPAPAPLPPHITGPLSNIRLLHIQLLALPELAFVVEGGEPARAELLEKLVAQAVFPRSRLARPSVV